MQSIPEAMPVQQLSDFHLRDCIAAPDTGHHARPDFFADYVHQSPQMCLLLLKDTTFETALALPRPIQIVNLFTGRGGMGNGFAASGDGLWFEIVFSAEKEPVAGIVNQSKARADGM